MSQMQIKITTAARGTEDITARVGDNWQFDTRAGVGYATARVTIIHPERDLWYLLNAKATDSIAFYFAGVKVWEGYVADTTLRGNQLVIACEGAGLRLGDIEVWRAYADPEFSHWDASAAGDVAGFGGDNNNRVYVEASGSFSDGDESTVTYPDDSDVVVGGEVVAVEARVVVTIASGAWIVELRDDAGAVLYTTSVAVDTTIDVDVDSADGLVWALRKDGDGDGEATARLTQVVVRTLDPSQSSDIVADVLGDAGIDTDGVSDSGVDVDRAIFQGDSRLAAIAEMREIGDGEATWLFTLYEEASFTAWPTVATWLLDAKQRPGSIEIGYRRSAVRNAVRARLPDGYITDWVTDADSIARFERVEETISLRQTSYDEAARLAQVYLADRAWPVASLRIEAGAVIETPDGSPWPVWRVRAGQVLTLRDAFPYRDFDIRVAEVRATPDGVTIVPFGADDRVEVQLAAQARQIARNTRSSNAAPDGGGGVSSGGGGGTGGGDMFKATYDPDGDGQVEGADDADALGGVVAADYLTEAEHTAIGDSSPHHARYTDAEAETAAPVQSVDGKTGVVDLSADYEAAGAVAAHASDADAHHDRQHDIDSAADHNGVIGVPIRMDVHGLTMGLGFEMDNGRLMGYNV